MSEAASVSHPQYRQTTDIYATAIDYELTAQAASRFSATMPCKLHGAIHGWTGTEVLCHRADASKDRWGLTSWADAPLGKTHNFDAVIAKTMVK